MEISFELVQKVKEHADLLHKWRSDPQAARMSVHKPKTADQFWHHFCAHYFVLKDLPAVFAWVDGKRVAFVGFDPIATFEKKSALISIVVAPEQRGKGIGTKVLEAICQYALQQGYDALYAEIKPDNKASKRIFEKAGFLLHKSYTRAVHHDNEQYEVPLDVFVRMISERKRDPVFIIAEAGSNWKMGSYERDLQMAKQLIYLAKEAGCDAIKFQTYRAETVYAPNAGKSDYLKESGYIEDIHAIFNDLSMPYEMISQLAAICQAIGIEFMSSAFSQADFVAIDPYVKRHKIASYEISHVRLLELAAKSQKPLILSTGASTLDDISWAIDYYRACGGKQISLLQCSAQYPAKPQCMNIRAISSMAHYFAIPCGLSDHSLDPLCAPLAAVSQGATIVEKHFTLDRRLIGPDHSFAVEPHELCHMVRAIRQVEEMLGSGVKEILPEENELFHFARRRIQAIQEIQKGERFVEDQNVAILRPGKQKPGVHPKYITELIGKKATRLITKGEGIEYNDWS